MMKLLIFYINNNKKHNFQFNCIIKHQKGLKIPISFKYRDQDKTKLLKAPKNRTRIYVLNKLNILYICYFFYLRKN